MSKVQEAVLQNSDDIEIRRDIRYIENEEYTLLGDFYLPKGASNVPVLIAVHGGGWAHRSRKTYQYWGPFLARQNCAVFEIGYRLGEVGMFPRSVHDVRWAVQFVRAHAAEYGVDPDRIGLVGDSAGAHLSALVAIANDQFRDDTSATLEQVSAEVKVAILFYGVYDMLDQWQHEQITRPNNRSTEAHLGAPPFRDRRVYFESSPISYATVGRTKTRFLIVTGTEDDVVDPAQAKKFQTALGQAGIYARSIVVPGAGHYWAGERFESDPHAFASQIAGRIMRFLDESL